MVVIGVVVDGGPKAIARTTLAALRQVSADGRKQEKSQSFFDLSEGASTMPVFARSLHFLRDRGIHACNNQRIVKSMKANTLEKEDKQQGPSPTSPSCPVDAHLEEGLVGQKDPQLIDFKMKNKPILLFLLAKGWGSNHLVPRDTPQL